MSSAWTFGAGRCGFGAGGASDPHPAKTTPSSRAGQNFTAPHCHRIREDALDEWEEGEPHAGTDVVVSADTHHVFDRAERIFPEKKVATVQFGGIDRITYGEWAERTRRLAGVLDTLEISADGRVGTFAWNTGRHLELYFAAPCSGRVLHTLNIRLFPDDITYIANHAEDEVIFVDRSLLKVLWPLVDDLETVKHVVVMDDGVDDEIPDDPRIHDYEALLSEADPVESSRSRTRTRPRRCVTRAARPAIRRASSTRTARPSCTRWARWSSTPPRSPSATP